MDDRLFLHDGEILLVNQRSSAAILLVSWVRGLLDAVILTIILSLIVVVAGYFGFEMIPAWYVYIILFVLSYLAVCWKRWKVWKHASLRVTSDRILVQTPTSLFHPHLTTIKWPQYQESFVGHRHFLDFFFQSRPLCVRYGTADAHSKSCFPSVTYAQDLKHYMDKVDSAVRKNQVALLKPFVAKPRGKRDEA
jgi:hypothetical protein